MWSEPKKTLKGVTVIGPVRSATQIELSMTDARARSVLTRRCGSRGYQRLGRLQAGGSKGEVELKEGVVVAKRHVHMTPQDAAEFGLKDGDIVSVRVDSEVRPLIFGNVVVRVRENFSLAMHIDTDEANAAGIVPGMTGTIVR